MAMRSKTKGFVTFLLGAVLGFFVGANKEKIKEQFKKK